MKGGKLRQEYYSLHWISYHDGCCLLLASMLLPGFFYSIERDEEAGVPRYEIYVTFWCISQCIYYGVVVVIVYMIENYLCKKILQQ